MSPITSSERRRGSMLIVALGVLTLLTVLAITFVALMRLELQASKNYVDGVKARLIAEGGLEKALAELKLRGGIEAASRLDSPWVYAAGNYQIPLEDARIPGIVDASGKVIIPPDPDYLAVDQGVPGGANYKPANRVSFWGTMGKSYNDGYDRYKIACLDANTQFNLNNTLDEDTYIRYLAVLGAVIAQTQKVPNPILRCTYPKTGGAAAKFGPYAILAFRDSREGKVFKSKSELQEILASEDDWKAIRNFVTTKSWSDPNITNAASISGFAMKTQPWSDSIRPKIEATSGGRLQRAPLNVNLAPKETLTANLAGLAGRALYLHAGDFTKRDDPTDPQLKAIDTDNAKWKYDKADEEHRYPTQMVIAYIDPFGYALPTSGDLKADPPRFDGAALFADLIIERRKTIGPFKSFAEWDRFVDQVVTDSFLSTSTGQTFFPAPQNAKVFALDETNPRLDPALEAEIKNSDRFKSFFYQCCRSVLKANVNPNPRISSFNPNAPAYLPIDKGSLFTPQKATGTGAFPDSKAEISTQTCEWCFAPKGVFELMALGEVLGRDPRFPYAQAKILAVIQLFDQVTLTSQQDFEKKGAVYGSDSNRLAMLSYPITRLFWDPNAGVDEITGKKIDDATKTKWLDLGGNPEGRHAHDIYGHLELSPKIQGKGDDDGIDSHVLGETYFGKERFAALYDQRRAISTDNPGVPKHNYFEDNFVADVANSLIQRQNPANTPLNQPTTEPAQSAYALPQEEGPSPGKRDESAFRGLTKPGGLFLQDTWRYELLNPDGYWTNELRNRINWFRASDQQCAKDKASPWKQDRGYDQGESAIRNGAGGVTNPGNVYATNTGAVEFWYKPEFDWFVRKYTPGAKFADPTPDFIADPNAGAKKLVDDRFCGLISTSCIVENDDVLAPDPAGAPQTKKTRGTQFFVMRNTSGDLRVTRLYFEVIGPSGVIDPTKNNLEFPLVRDIKAMGPGVAAKLITLTDYMERASKDTSGAYTWPPVEFQGTDKVEGFKDIKFARIDTWVQATHFQKKQWRAHEWHHIGVHWNDKEGDETKAITIFLDGAPLAGDVIWRPAGKTYQATVNTVGGATPPAPPTEKPLTAFVRLNEKANAKKDYPVKPANKSYNMYPKDMFTIGTIWRNQVDRGGVFKHVQKTATGALPAVLLPAHGTLDDVRFYEGSVDVHANSLKSGRPANRYEPGFWTGEIDLSDRFGQDNALVLGQMGFTAYLPTDWADVHRPDGGGSVTVTIQVQAPDGSIKKTADGEPMEYKAEFSKIGPVLNDPNNPDLPFKALVSSKGMNAIFQRYPAAAGGGTTSTSSAWEYDKLVYKVDMEPFRNNKAHAVVSPVLDDLSVTYYLPSARVLIKENVYD